MGKTRLLGSKGDRGEVGRVACQGLQAASDRGRDPSGRDMSMIRTSSCAALVALAMGAVAQAQTPTPGANIGGGRVVIPNTTPIFRGAAGTNLRGPFPGYKVPTVGGAQATQARTPTLIESVGVTL